MMDSYVTYKMDTSGKFYRPYMDGNNFGGVEDPLTQEDLISMGYVASERPILVGDSITIEVVYLDESDTDIVYGPDGIHYYGAPEEEESGNVDDDHAASVLSNNVSKAVSMSSIAKSMMDFDLNSAEGVKNILNSLPIMDPAIVAQIMSAIWPGVDTSMMGPKQMKEQIKGYLVDYMNHVSIK